MVVHAPQPSLEVHDDSVQVREICPFFARRYAREVLELLLQGGISGPLVGGHFGLLAYVVSHKSTQLQGTSLGYNPGVKARDPLALLLDADHNKLLFLVLPSTHALFLAPEDRLVHFCLASYGMVLGTLHRLHDLALEGPAGLLPQGQLAGKLRGGDALFVGRDQIDDPEGLD